MSIVRQSAARELAAEKIVWGTGVIYLELQRRLGDRAVSTREREYMLDMDMLPAVSCIKLVSVSETLAPEAKVGVEKAQN